MIARVTQLLMLFVLQMGGCACDHEFPNTAISPGFQKLFLIHTQKPSLFARKGSNSVFAPTLLFEQGDGWVGNLKTLEPKVKQENS